MLCQNCKKNEATTHIKRVLNGEATQSHLCSACAQSLGYNNLFDDFSLNLPGLFSGFFDDTAFALGESRLDRCEVCGSSFDDIIREGTVGCANCYEKFYSKLLPSIQRIHGKVKHAGKVPSVKVEAPKPAEEAKVTDPVKELEEEMEKAVKEQNFERAAIIRDQIKELKGDK